jgi:hypothetical protein
VQGPVPRGKVAEEAVKSDAFARGGGVADGAEGVEGVGGGDDALDPGGEAAGGRTAVYGGVERSESAEVGEVKGWEWG